MNEVVFFVLGFFVGLSIPWLWKRFAKSQALELVRIALKPAQIPKAAAPARHSPTKLPEEIEAVKAAKTGAP